VNRQHPAAGSQYLSGLSHEVFWLREVKNIEQQNRVAALRCEPKPGGQHVAQGWVDIAHSLVRCAGKGARDHRAFDVKREQGAPDPPRRRQRKRAIAAAQLGDVLKCGVDFKSIQNQWDVEQRLPIDFLGHTALRHFHCGNGCRTCATGQRKVDSPRSGVGFTVAVRIMIRPATPHDAASLCRIYNPYVLGSIITFEEDAVTEEAMRARIAEVGATLPWLVLEEAGAVVAYAYATRWRMRSAYRFSVESTVYVDASCPRRGFGLRLYAELLRQLHERGLHRVVGGIALPNAASIGLHESLGFRKVAHFTEVGFKLGRWIDVGYWELGL
jgi:L-amino acid N-acyltransferase YncA